MNFASKYPYLTALLFLFLCLFGPFFVYYYEEVGEFLSVYSHLEHFSKPSSRPLPPKENQEYIRVLAIEGGGIYGILPAHVICYLEEKTGKPATELFDVMMGTSTGAILNVMLNIPNHEGAPKYTAKEALDLYNKEAVDIFYSPWYHRILTLNGLIGAKYKTKERYDLFRKYIGGLYFDSLINNVIVPAYDMKNKNPLLFRNWIAKDQESENFSVVDLLMGAVSFPGFFPSVVLGSGSKEVILTDGALFVNNPSLAALLLAMKMYPNKKYILVSLGTGTPRETKQDAISSQIVNWGDLQWSTSLIQDVLNADKKFNNLLIKTAVPFPVEHYLFTIERSSKNGGVDNVTSWNISRLNKEGERMVSSHLEELDDLIPKLLNP